MTITWEMLLLAAIWLVGIGYRIFRQARFFQIEEYMSVRYLRWCLARRNRWLPRRAILAVGLGIVLTVILSEGSGRLLPTMIGLAATVAAIWPEAETEVKKGFRATPRAQRLLAGAFIVAVFVFVLALLLLSRLPIPDMNEVTFSLLALLGLGLYVSAPLILVAGNLLMTPLEAFQRRRFVASARAVLARLRPVVIGITGSYGKTTTKTYLTHILNGRYHAYATPKSYNTMMGVCIAINNDLTRDNRVEYFVCEMGAYIPGEIARLCDLTNPSISLVIEVGPQHLERFGSLENIAIAKYEIIKALPPDGLGVFNWDNPHVRSMYARGYPKARLAVSLEADPATAPADGPRFIASSIQESLDGLRFTVHDQYTGEQVPFETNVLGRHNVLNILMATAVAVYEGMRLPEIAQRVKTLQPAESRLVRQTTDQGITIINDAYSTNPVGSVEALKVLGMHQTGRRLLITPGMIELGDQHDVENRKLGIAAAQYATDVILVGADRTRPIREGLLAAGFPQDRLQTVEALRLAVEWYQSNFQAGDSVLFLNDLPDTYSTT